MLPLFKNVSMYVLKVKFYCFDILNKITELLMTIMFKEVASMTMHLYLAFRILFKSVNEVSHVLPTLIHIHEEIRKNNQNKVNVQMFYASIYSVG